MLDGLVGNLLAFFLERSNELLEAVNKNCLNLAGEQLSLAVLLAYLFQFLVVLEEEGKVLERNINFQISAVCAVLLNGSTTS